MRLVTGLFSVNLLWACTVGVAWSFNLSPCLRVLTMEGNQLKQQKIRTVNQCDSRFTTSVLLGGRTWLLDAVHEHQTLAAIRKYRREAGFAGPDPLQRTKTGWKYQYMIERPWAVVPGKPHRTAALMYGTWWNDDPVMRAWGQDFSFVSGSLHAVWSLPAARYQGGTANCLVEKEDYFGLAAHEGAMQYLHFMSSDSADTTQEARIANTTERALRWMEFAYRVATGEVSPNDIISAQQAEELALPRRWYRNHCKPDTQVKALFSRVGWSREQRVSYPPDIALGTMLHVIQDSFSPAHTCRIARGEGSERVAVLIDVFNYAAPDHDRDVHKQLDRHPSWILPLVQSLDRRETETQPLAHTYSNDPVATGAMLLAAVDNKLPWRAVKDELLRTVFRSGVRTPEEKDAPCIR